MFPGSAVFLWWRSASYTDNLGMCVRSLSVSFRELGGWWFCCGRIYSLIVPSSPAQQLFFVSTSSHFPSFTLESAFCFRRQVCRGSYMVSLWHPKTGWVLPHWASIALSPHPIRMPYSNKQKMIMQCDACPAAHKLFVGSFSPLFHPTVISCLEQGDPSTKIVDLNWITHLWTVHTFPSDHILDLCDNLKHFNPVS